MTNQNNIEDEIKQIKKSLEEHPAKVNFESKFKLINDGFLEKILNVMLKKHFEEIETKHILWFKFGTQSKLFKENSKLLDPFLYCEKENQRSLLGNLYFGDFTYDEFDRRIQTLSDVLCWNQYKYSFHITWNDDFKNSILNRRGKMYYRNPINIKRYYILDYWIRPIEEYMKLLNFGEQTNLSPDTKI